MRIIDNVGVLNKQFAEVTYRDGYVILVKIMTMSKCGSYLLAGKYRDKVCDGSSVEIVIDDVEKITIITEQEYDNFQRN